MKLSDLFTQFVPPIMDDWKEDGGCLVAGPHTLPPSTPQQVSLNWYNLTFCLENKLIYLMDTMRGYTVFYSEYFLLYDHLSHFNIGCGTSVHKIGLLWEFQWAFESYINFTCSSFLCFIIYQKMLFPLIGYLMQTHGKCLADLCGAMHCDAVMNFRSSRSKCNLAAASKNRHLCEVAFILFYFFYCSWYCQLFT